MSYHRANFAPLRETGYGIAVHWTTWTAPREGLALPFEEMVERFDVDAFVEQAVETGAGHVFFTLTHAVHHLPCPHPEVDRLISGRTCRRDLIGELADGLARAGIRLALYYNHGVYQPPHGMQDPQWQEAVGSTSADRSRYHDHFCRIVGWLGEHYGEKVIAWWFDSGYEFAKYADTPWERYTRAAKAGHPERLVTYNSGIASHLSYTPHQDYWAGELNTLSFVPDALGSKLAPGTLPPTAPQSPLTPSGLPWFAYLTWHVDPVLSPWGEWGISMRHRDLYWAPPRVEAVASFLSRFWHVGGTVTFNQLCHSDGTILPGDFAVLKELRAMIARGELRRPR